MSRYFVNEKTKKIHKKPTKDYKCPALYIASEENFTDYNVDRLKKELKSKKKYYSFCDRCMPHGIKNVN